MGKRFLNSSSNLADSITLEMIKEKIEEKLDSESVQVIVGNDLGETLVIRVRLHYSDEDLKQLEQNNKEDFEVHLLRHTESMILNDIPIMGLYGIRKVYMEEIKMGKRWIDDNGEVKHTPCWVVLTEGSDLASILRHPYVDSTLTTSNDIRETLDVLGIEAARTCLFNELQEVFGSGSYINYRHVALLVETMTYRGHLLSISRHGFNRIETGPLMRCSFEETVEILFEAAMYGQRDNMKGIILLIIIIIIIIIFNL
jgi:DNA-directed RNA polymerase II subunit RPB1